jgi:hypothetical protein
MKTLLLAISLAVLGTAAGAIAEAPAVSRPVIRSAEQSLDERLSRLWQDPGPMALVSRTRGVYLDGYGVVFTADMNPVSDGVNMFTPHLQDKDKVLIKQKKIARIPELKKALKEALVDTAASLDPVPLDEQVVLAVVIRRFEWEDGSGYPAEVVVQSTRRKLLDVKRANGAGLDAAIRLTER